MTTVESAEEAIDHLKTHPDVSLVVTDEELEGMDGIALTTEIRRTKGLKDLAIIGVSGNYLTKPRLVGLDNWKRNLKFRQKIWPFQVSRIRLSISKNSKLKPT